MVSKDPEQIADLLADAETAKLALQDPTLVQLKDELEKFASEFRKPAPETKYDDESALRRGLEFVKAIGRTTASLRQNCERKYEERVLESLREYKLLGKIGEGGMGTVYEALHTKLNRVVAIKVLPADRTQDYEAVERFEREMRAVGTLDHPNVVRAMDAGEVDGTHFLVMEYVTGVDLSTLVKRLGPLPVNAACELIRQAAIGLSRAHELGIVHRDLKPSNLMLASERHQTPIVKILDLGLALLEDLDPKSPGELTTTGQVMGTLDYMSPEQASDSHVVDVRSDIYSLGATLFKLLCGRAPFSGSDYNTPTKKIVALATQPAPSIAQMLPDAPAELIDVVDRMLAREPSDRPATASEVAAALMPLADGADLAAVLGRAQSADAEAAIEQTLETTHDALKSGSVKTKPTIELQRRRTQSHVLRRIRRWLVLAAAVLGALLLGIVVRIIRDQGNPTVVKVDKDQERLQVTIEGEGTVAGVLHDDDLAKFNNAPGLVSLNADETSISDAGLRQLDVPGLQKLFLHNTNITDRGLAELRRFPALRVLHVTGTATTDAGLPHIAELSELIELDLGGDAITDAGFAHLYGLKKLQTLRLKKTKVTADGIAKLNLVLPECDVESDLSRQDIDEAIDNNFAHHRDVAEWLSSIDAQFGLGVEGRGAISVDPGDTLPATRFQVVNANIAKCISVTDRDLARFEGLPLFDTLVASDTTIGDEGLRQLDVPLEKLYLWNTQVTDRGLAELSRFPKLSLLHLSDTAVTDEGLQHLASCKNLSELDLVRCRITDAGLVYLHELFRLQTLRLKETQVSAIGLARFRAYLPNCKIESDVPDADVAATTSEMQARSREVAEWLGSVGAGFAIAGEGIGFTPMNPGDALPDRPFHIMGFNVKQPDRFGDDELSRVGDLPVANTLVLNQTSVGDAGLERLGDLPLLSRLYLTGTKVRDRGLAELKRFPNLAVLHLTDTAVTDEGLKHLADCEALTKLDLVRCQVTDTGLTHLYGLTTLQTIWLYETGVTADGVNALWKALPGCSIQWK